MKRKEKEKKRKGKEKKRNTRRGVRDEYMERKRECRMGMSCSLGWWSWGYGGFTFH